MAAIASPRCGSESDRQSREFQKKFIREAIDLIGTQADLARMLCLSQQTISNYLFGNNILALSRMIRIAKLVGLKEIHVTWD